MQVVVPSVHVVVWVTEPWLPGLPTRTATLTLLVPVCVAEESAADELTAFVCVTEPSSPALPTRIETLMFDASL